MVAQVNCEFIVRNEHQRIQLGKIEFPSVLVAIKAGWKDVFFYPGTTCMVFLYSIDVGRVGVVVLL